MKTILTLLVLVAAIGLSGEKAEAQHWHGSYGNYFLGPYPGYTPGAYPVYNYSIGFNPHMYYPHSFTAYYPPYAAPNTVPAPYGSPFYSYSFPSP